MVTRSQYRIFLSAASAELASYRRAVAEVLRRKGIEVCDQEHFRQGGATLLEKLNDYIAGCDAIIFLVGDQCGSLPSAEHMAVMNDHESVKAFRAASGQSAISYTQWEYLLAGELNKARYVYLTGEGFQPDRENEEDAERRELQAAYRDWIRTSGKDRESVTSVEQLLVDILVLPFPDILQAQPNNLPQASLGSLFKGRDRFLNDLHDQLYQTQLSTTAITDKVDPQRPQAVRGAGGIGKTRAAIEYAWRYAAEYSAVLFLSAPTPSLLHSGLAGLTQVLPLADLSESPDEQRVAAVLNWLQAHPDWLLILDNVDDELAVRAVKELLPRLAAGHVLITSRFSRWGASVNTLDLDVLDEEDAVAYLLEATDGERVHTDQDADSAKQVAQKVGRLALGLEHAAALIKARFLSFDDYLSLWNQNEAQILEAVDLEEIEYPHELLVTWQLSVNQLTEEAKGLLGVLSWLSPEPIPETFFKTVSEDGQSSIHRAVANLCKYSLANRTQESDQRGVQIHRLVQSTTRYHQLRASDNKLPALSNALDWINTAYQGTAADVRDWPQLEPLAEHVEAVCQFAEQYEKVGQAYPTSRLLNELAQLYDHKARYAAAEPLMRRALAIDEQSFGKDHPEVATDLNNLAQLLWATNRVSEAEPLMRRALAIDEQSFGEDHPNVSRHLNNLAGLLQATNCLSEAEPLMLRALVIDEQSFGEDHPTVARDLNNLATLLQATNRVSEAEPLMRRALAIDEQSFGEDHPEVAIRLNNLAQLLQATNRMSEAEPLMRRALQIDEHSFGEDHPTVATNLNNLAGLLQATNCLSEAEPLMRRALAIDEQSFGEDHPTVARDLNNLGQLLKATNRVSEAEPLMRRALAIDEQSFGEDHPNVAIRLNNLAQLLKATNRLSEAEPLMRRVVEIFHQFALQTGHQHPHMEAAVNNYESLLIEMGVSSEEAVAKVRTVLESEIAVPDAMD